MEQHPTETAPPTSNSSSQNRRPLFSLGRRATGKEPSKSAGRDAAAATAEEVPQQAHTSPAPAHKVKDKRTKKKHQNLSSSSANGKKSPMLMRNSDEQPGNPSQSDSESQSAHQIAESSAKAESKGLKKFGIRRYAGKTLFGAIDLIRSPSASPHLRTSSPYLRAGNVVSRSFTTSVIPSLVGNGLFMTHESTTTEAHVDDALMNAAKDHVFLFRELNAMLEPVRNIEFIFDVSSENLMYRSEDAEGDKLWIMAHRPTIHRYIGPFDVYDSYRKVLLMDTGLLIGKPLVFQIQSSTRGIKVLEASMDREKQMFFKVIQSARSTFNPFMAAPGGADQSSDAAVNQKPISISSTPGDKEQDDVYIGVPPDSVPLFFVRRWRQNMNDLLASRMTMANHDAEAERVISHLGFLKSNIEALEEDLLYFKAQNDQRNAEIQRTNEDSVKIQTKLDEIRTFVAEKRHIVLQDELPRRMTNLAANIKLLQRRENTKVLRVILISLIVIVVVLFCAVWIYYYMIA